MCEPRSCRARRAIRERILERHPDLVEDYRQ